MAADIRPPEDIVTVEPDPPILSVDAAMQFVGDPDLFVEIAEMLLEELPEQMALIDEHAGNRDLAELAKTAHRLKGNFGVVAAGRAQAAAKRLEQVARAGDEAAAEPAVAALVEAVAQVAPLLEQHVAAKA